MSQLTISDFASLDDYDKLITLEIKPARQLAEETWTQCDAPNTNAWYISFTDGEVVSVEEDGEEYDEEYSISDCHGNASSFYYDDFNKILYIQTSGSDDPATLDAGIAKYSIVAYFWVGFANKSVIYERYDQLLLNNIFNYWDTANDAEEWTEATAGTSTVAQNTTVDNDVIELYTCKITIDAGGDEASTYQDVSTKPRRKCKIRIKYKATVGSGLVRIYDTAANVYLNSDSEWQSGATACITLANTSTVTTLELDFVAHEDYSAYRVMVLSATANSQIFVSRIDFFRYRQPIYYKTTLSDNLPVVTQSVGTYVFPQALINMSEIIVNTDGWWWDKKDIYLWHNKRIILRLGEATTDYEDLAIGFYGLMREPLFGILEIKLQTQDDRLILKTIPTDKFDSTNYPNCEDDWAEKGIPIYLGDGNNLIKPPETDTTIFKYKMSQATFAGTNYQIQEIAEVRKDGALLTGGGVDYTADLANGEFTLTADPGASEITCKGSGVKFSLFGDAFAWRPADILYFYLVLLNGIDKHRINLASFKDLFDNRNLYCHEWIYGEQGTTELINKLQTTGVFQYFSRLDGTIEARRYNSDEPSDILYFYTEDFANWEINLDTNHTYKELVFQYKQDYVNSIFEEMFESSTPPFDADKIEWEHDIKDRLTIETNLQTTLQVEDLWENYMSIMEDPIEILSGEIINHAGLMLNPTDKIKVTLKKTYDGVEKTIYDEEMFQIIKLEKDLNTGNTRFDAFIGWDQLVWTIT